MSVLGPPIRPKPAEPAPEKWETVRPGLEKSTRTGLFRTVDINTTAEDYLRELARRQAP